MLEITDINYARELDSKDPLSGFRQEFIIAEKNLIYLDGNSLGRTPKRTKEKINELVEKEWAGRLIRGWSENWLEMPRRIGGKIAHLIGASEDEVLVCDATSVNLFKLTMAALKFQKNRFKVITDELNFPSDLYIMQGVIDLLGEPYELHTLASNDNVGIYPNSIQEAIDQNTALLSFTHTYFKSSFMQDMKRVTAMAHKAGSMILWDLSHSIGAVPVDLNGCQADLAVGCTYKYLNGGPGSPAFLYVRRDLQEKLQQPIQGWLGSGQPFDFKTEYEPSGGIEQFQVGTPPILSMAAIEPGIDLHLNAGISALREKSIRQSQYLIQLFDEWLEPLGFSLGSPRDPDRRGSHVALRHPEASIITEELIGGGNGNITIIPDFRQPDNIRLGIAPLYNSYEEVYTGMQRIREVTEKIMESL